MSKSLCGRRFCRHLCSRHQHCPAGQARVDWLWFYRRSVRALSKPQAAPQARVPPGVDPETGEISEARHNYGALNFPMQKRQSKILPDWYEKEATPLYTAWMKPFKSLTFVGGLAVFIAIVVSLGVLFGGLKFDHVPKETAARKPVERTITLQEQQGNEWIERNKWMWEN